MSANYDSSLVSFGEFVYLVDNYHWNSLDSETSSYFEKLISQNRFPLYPDTLFIVMCRSGKISLSCGDAKLVAGPRDAIIILGGQPIESVDISTDCKFLFFSGKSKYFNTQIDLDDANRILRHALEIQHPFIFRLTSKEFSAVEKLFFSAKELLQMTCEEGKSRIISGYARIVSTLIAMRLKDQEREPGNSVANGNKALLTDFLDNVRKHCKQERGIAFYSNLANLTPKYFSRQIRKLSGKSPGAIIEEYTMAEAKGLLSSKKYSVKEVSNLMNFSTPSSFCKYFKAAEGIAPGQYIRHYQ